MHPAQVITLNKWQRRGKSIYTCHTVLKVTTEVSESEPSIMPAPYLAWIKYAVRKVRQFSVAETLCLLHLFSVSNSMESYYGAMLLMREQSSGNLQ